MTSKSKLLLGYNPPSYAISLASRRTYIFLNNLDLLNYNLREVLISVYLQAIEDTVSALSNKNLLNENKL